MSKTLTIIARIEANKDKVDFLKAELLKLIEPTLKEEGCLQYDLHQDNENPAVFYFYENWQSKELLQAHLQSEHLTEYVRVTEGCTASFTLNELTKV